MTASYECLKIQKITLCLCLKSRQFIYVCKDEFKMKSISNDFTAFQQIILKYFNCGRVCTVMRIKCGSYVPEDLN